MRHGMALGLALAVLAPAGVAWGQGAGQTAQLPTVEDPQIPPEPTEVPTLPPIIVRPEPSEQPPDDGVTPPTALASPFDLPSSYPRMSQQRLEGYDGLGLDGAARAGVSLVDLPALATVINRRQLEERQATDMARALEYEVGVLVQQTARGQASPFVRGLTGQQVLILIDGVRLNNSTFRAGTNQYFNLIDPGMVERIEIVRGSQSVLWGSDAIGGVINVVSRGASPWEADYGRLSFNETFSSADLGSYTRGNVEGWVGPAGVFAGGSYQNVNNLDTGGPLGRQPMTDYAQYAGDVKMNWLVGDDQMLTVALQHFEQEDLPRSDRFAPFVLGPPANSPRPTFFDPQQRDLAYVRLQGLSEAALFDAYTTTFSYQRNREATSELRPEQNRLTLSEFDVGTLGFNLTLARDLGWVGTLTYGGDWYYDDVDAVRNRITDPANPASPSVPQNPQFPDDAVYQRAGGFVSWSTHLTERLNLLSGVRYETVSASGTLNEVSGARQHFVRSYDDWIGTAGLVYELAPELRLVGSVSEGFRAPNLDDLTADNPVLQSAEDVPSLDVRPERAISYEVGIKLDSDRLRLQVFEFWTDLRDNILRQAVDAAGNPLPNVTGPLGTLVPGSDRFIRANFDSYVNGTELAGEYLLEGGWSLYGNFWYTYGHDLERDEPLSRIPSAQGVLGLRWRSEQRRSWFDVFTWMVRRQDRYAAQNNTDSRFPVGGTPGYATLNARMGTALGCRRNHQVSLSLENITDKAYRVLGSGVDGAGTSAVLGYTFVR